jgi:hypothetical protein
MFPQEMFDKIFVGQAAMLDHQFAPSSYKEEGIIAS